MSSRVSGFAWSAWSLLTNAPPFWNRVSQFRVLYRERKEWTAYDLRVVLLIEVLSLRVINQHGIL